MIGLAAAGVLAGCSSDSTEPPAALPPPSAPTTTTPTYTSDAQVPGGIATEDKGQVVCNVGEIESVLDFLGASNRMFGHFTTTWDAEAFGRVFYGCDRFVRPTGSTGATGVTGNTASGTG